LTELADHLVREHDLPFGAAHGITARMLAELRRAPSASRATVLAQVSTEMLGQPLRYSDEDLARVLSARHFVEVRRTHGGPAPEETGRALARSRQCLADDVDWLTAGRERLTEAEARLHDRSRAL
jgi:argininosuccinate lyase